MSDAQAINAARRALAEARLLATDDNALVSVSGRRVVAILVDLLLEIEPGEVSDPWELLLPPRARE